VANPFLKKNPFVSMWLSEANRMANATRGQATAQAKRQISAVITKATQDNLKAVLGTTAPAPPKAKRKKRR